MNRLYVVEGTPTPTGASADHRLALRSSEIEGFARAVAAGRRRDASRAATAHALGRAGREGPEARRGAGPRDRRRVAAAGRPRARARDQRGARHGRARPSPTRRPPSPRRSARRPRSRRSSADMDAGRGRGARDPRREPGLRRAGRPRLRRGAREGAPAHPPRPLRRRDRRALPLARARRALPRELGRRARLRRHGHDRPAADRAALRHALRARGPRRLRRGRADGLRHRPRALGGSSWAAADFEALAPGAPRRRRRRAPPSRRRRSPVAARRRGRSRGSAGRPPAALEVAFRPDPDGLRRALREQRLAAGAAEAAHAS